MRRNAPSQPLAPVRSDALRSLYICYFPITEPLVQTQVVAYLEALSARGHTIHLLTYETTAMTNAQQRQWRARLKKQGIIWHHLRYHKRPTLPATLYDVLCGIAVGVRLIRRHRLNAVHARAHVPAAMAVALKKLCGVRVIFDIRGLIAEEMVDSGQWVRGGLPYRITDWMQRTAIARADGIVVLTQRIRKVLFGDDPRLGTSLQVIPCCADLSQIEAQSDQRDIMRRELKLEDKTVMVYVGKFGGWYQQAEMVDFFAAAQQEIPNLHFLILTQSDPELIRAEFERRKVLSEAYTITQSPPQQVGSYLAASDFAISFIAAMPSKVASSPTKIGEYLAAGLPVVCNAGVGDVDLDIQRFDVGVVVLAFDDQSYREAARKVLCAREDVEQRERCRHAAHQTVSLDEIGAPRYDALYRAIAALDDAED